ncbi:MAG TPA: carbamoyl-phosphate synthase large subunit [Phycisphaerae bacterium]|nr:carbamoyl-phosphate synthase large subunit [Phycisphaerae bacterium]
MPRRDDLHTILIIGSGPIVIGQGCEFDYSGTQACKALREEGYRIVLINSNPATIMTDPQFADRTYIEPITPLAVGKIIAAENRTDHRIDALLPTLGGQTGLNTAVALADMGVLDRFGVEMIGATREVIHRAEDRIEFKNLCLSIGLDVPRSGIAHTMDEARKVLDEVGLPVCIRPAYTLGGTGGGFAFNVEEFDEIAARGLEYSPISEILIEESVRGWKEYELEVMRDRADNVVIVCSIENFDPMGVHTGDSITVAPAQTLTDKEYQLMRDAAIAIIRAIGVETGGSNIQFAVDPATGRMVIVEMNPRVSRSSALASKATGFPIAKIAAKLACGYTLDEIPNDITRKTPACFEPTIDYCVVKIPRWTFEKFPEADETLTTQMKSVGEAMSIGRTFKEALQKGIRSMEVKRFGLGLDGSDKWLNARKAGTGSSERSETCLSPLSVQHASQANLGVDWPIDDAKLRRKLSVPCQGRLYYIRYAFKMGWTVEQVRQLTQIDPWFLTQIKQLVEFEDELVEAGEAARTCHAGLPHCLVVSEHSDHFRLITDKGVENDAVGAAWDTAVVLRECKQRGYSDIQIATAWGLDAAEVRHLRSVLGVLPVYKLVDTCAAEFEAYTPYYYSTYEAPIAQLGEACETASDSNPKSEIRNPKCDDEVRISDKKKIVILGGGPNRIGQGIEFDYCCVHAAFAAREMGYEAVMVNSNPETVSTDYDTSDLLFFEPLTHEDVLNICERLNGQPFGTTGVSPVAESTRCGGDRRDACRTTDGLLHGVIVQFGGQTPLNLARGLEAAGVPIIGTSPESIDLAEDRKRFAEVLDELGLKCPEGGTAFSVEQARKVAARIGYPVLVRPSYVLGGRAMEIVSDEAQLDVYMAKAVDASTVGREHPILIDRFLADATEVDVDCIADFGPRPGGTREKSPRAVICGVMEHIEAAGIHSGDSACSLPPYSLPPQVVEEIKRQAMRLAERLTVRGLMNVQFAVKDDEVYILEVNPRASRTVPFVSKATGVPWARLAAKVMAGESLASLGVAEAPRPKQTSVKESVFPFAKFPGVDVILGPEMRSTGEVMGVDMSFGLAFAKSQMAAGVELPTEGTVFVSVCDADKPRVAAIGKALAGMGFEIVATQGTCQVLSEAGVPARAISKLTEGRRPNVLDLIANGQVDLLINTPTRRGPTTDEGRIRAQATLHRVPLITTITAAEAAAEGIAALRTAATADTPAAEAWGVRPLQEYFPT